MNDFRLPDRTWSGAVDVLVEASNEMVSDNVARPKSGFGSLSGFAGEIDLYLRGVSVARAALADAAKTAGRSAHSLMESSASLDSQLAASLNTGYAVKGSS